MVLKAIRQQKFRKLAIWQKAMDVISDIYKTTKSFPKEEVYGLTNQLRRSSLSIALNIAEGSGCSSDLEFRRFLAIAFRSAYESMCAIEVAMKLGYLLDSKGTELLDKLEELSAMISGFMKKLGAR